MNIWSLRFLLMGILYAVSAIFEPIPKLKINFLFVLDMSANFRESKRFFVFTYKALLPFSHVQEKGLWTRKLQMPVTGLESSTCWSRISRYTARLHRCDFSYSHVYNCCDKKLFVAHLIVALFILLTINLSKNVSP